METLRVLIEVALWLCLGVVAYVYVGYPLTLRAWPRRRSAPQPPATPPRVTIVIPAFNEAAHIDDTARNKLAQDYPRERLDVIVVSDGSTDGTDAIVEAIADPRLRLLRQEPRQGKTLALNRAVDASTGDLIVFSDANSIYADDAVRRLVEAFDDPSVGYATGSLVYEDPGETAVGGGSGIYMKYESWLRQLETRVGSVVGVNGGVDAVRRSLYRPMRADHLPDFILPLRVVEAGHRVVSCDEAVSRERALGRHRDEYKMRVRVSLRTFHSLWEMRNLLHPRFGLFAFQLLVHKALRYLLFAPLVAAFLLNLALLDRPFYRVLFALQAACYLLAAVGWLSGGRIKFRPVFVPFYFCLINVAAGDALVRFLRGERQVLWTPRKGA
jgi:cellulose synthase/poly-beta-1,6-N-acetylglucosamine synthase-like glycosyltransferase